MAFVVTESCIKCKYTDCVEVCPVDAFHEGPNFLVIDPNVCIDCVACVAECPVEAIYADAEVPKRLRNFTALNAELSRDWPGISRKREPLPEAGHWATVQDKLGELRQP
jgi:ferredoxin